MKSFISTIVLTIAAAAFAALPGGYVELEWIESTGRQYIDTGVTMTDAHGFRADYQSMTFQENGNFCGSRADATDTRCVVGSNLGPAAYVGWNTLVLARERGVRDSQRSEVRVNYLGSRKVVLQDVEVALTEPLAEQKGTFYVFAGNYAYNASSPRVYGEYRLYSFQMSENGACIRDFVPARRESDGEIGLYELVEGRFYPNQDTREAFLAGPSKDSGPVTYEHLEYLQSHGTEYHGTEYIDTGVTFTDRHGYEITYQAMANVVNGNVCGSRASGGDTRCVLGSNNGWVAYLGWNTLVVPASLKLSDKEKATVSVNYRGSRKAVCRGAVVENLPALAPQTGTFYLFGGHYSYSGQTDVFGSYRVYSFRMTEGERIILDLVPARRHPDGALGMQDRISGRFFPNQGAGAFSAGGPRVEPLPDGYAELAYLESTGTQYIDTGVKCTGSVRVETTVYDPLWESRHILGARTAFRQNALGLSHQTENGNVGFCVANGASVVYRLATLPSGGWRSFAFGAEPRIQVDGITVGSRSTPSSFTTDLDIYAFTVNNNGAPHGQSAHARMSALKIWDGFTLVRDYVPAMETNTLALGFYDRVNGVFATNAGTGDFVAGRIGAGFRTVNLVANGGFESGTSVPARRAETDLGWLPLADAGTAGWTGDGYVTRASNSWVVAHRMLDGTYAAALGDGKYVEQVVEAARSGRYRLVFEHMPGGMGANTLQVSLDGVVVKEVGNGSRYGFVTENLDLKIRTGRHVLRFEGRGSGGTCIDGVSLQLLEVIPMGTLLLVR